MYELQYLPLALKDLRGITDYITDTVRDPEAAMDFLNALNDSISMLQQFPYSYRIYQSIQPLESEYRLLPVKNYVVFYIVKEEVVEIHRVVYGKMDLTKVLK
ncbi:type II toxin-antitoxin system RelE/ParE family toxin [Aquibacillus koreensis]|uniref:type II toxin-antitoxin system RelE/ParE family toxin n=1 Tax=Aquibacillus koreensis TaxID=279446 RepID=UPI0021A3962E|nr:type II toxin-antitoxin system RelE/ParE family toxin [Aquibacillus koreensis]MCT2536707.1 type II toxin-antitoxin system RelE/ParE family toxin [Aquibacillus koreensis]